MKRIIGLLFFAFLVNSASLNANTVTLNNTTNAQYFITYYDIMGNVLADEAVGVYASHVRDFGSANAAYCRVIIGLGSTPPGPGDMVEVGHFTTSRPPFLSSANVYSFLSGGPFSAYWNQPGSTATTPVTLNII